MNRKKLKNPTRATSTDLNFQSFCEFGKKLKYSLKPIFKNPNFEFKDELKKAVSHFEFHC